MITATFKTKSNFRNLNGVLLEVVEMSAQRITCAIFDEELGKTINADFYLKELTGIYTNKPIETEQK